MVVKVIELVGSSSRNWTEAVENAVAEAGRTVDGISGVEVLNFTASIKDNCIFEYKANVKVAFCVRN
jgi:hypothetical protein